jgi:hypothetical protein
MVQFCPSKRFPQSAVSTASPKSGTTQLPGIGVVELVLVVVDVVVVVVNVVVVLVVDVLTVEVDVVELTVVELETVVVVVVVIGEQTGGVPWSSIS